MPDGLPWGLGGGEMPPPSFFDGGFDPSLVPVGPMPVMRRPRFAPMPAPMFQDQFQPLTPLAGTPVGPLPVGEGFASAPPMNFNSPSMPTPAEIPDVPDERSWLGWALSVLGRPGNAVRSVLDGQPLQGLKSLIPYSGYQDKDQVTGQDLLHDYFGMNKSNDFFSPEGFGGLAVDIATDPFTYGLGFGAKNAAAKAAELVGGEIASAGRTAAHAIGAAGSEEALNAARIAQQGSKARTIAELLERPAGDVLGDAARTGQTGLGETLSQQAELGQRSLMKIGGHVEPLGIFKLPMLPFELLRGLGLPTPIDAINKIPFLGRGFPIPEVELIKGAPVLKGIGDAAQMAADTPAGKFVGGLFNKFAGVTSGAADSIRSAVRDYKGGVQTDIEQAAAGLKTLNEDIAGISSDPEMAQKMLKSALSQANNPEQMARWKHAQFEGESNANYLWRQKYASELEEFKSRWAETPEGQLSAARDAQAARMEEEGGRDDIFSTLQQKSADKQAEALSGAWSGGVEGRAPGMESAAKVEDLVAQGKAQQWNQTLPERGGVSPAEFLDARAEHVPVEPMNDPDLENSVSELERMFNGELPTEGGLDPKALLEDKEAAEAAARPAQSIEQMLKPRDVPERELSPLAQKLMNAEPTGPNELATLPTSEIHADPERFQYKLNPGLGGATGSTSGRVFNPDMVGTLQVWKDPANGQTYVVNGHNRLSLASKAGVPELNVEYLHAATAQEARVKGALSNIAENNGTPFDAATVFRETGLGPEHLVKMGLKPTEGLASQGQALSGLSDDLFKKALSGELPVERAAMIGAARLDPDEQAKLLAYLGKKKNWNNGVLQEALDSLANTGKRITSEETLFGTDTKSESLFEQKMQIQAQVKQLLSQQRNVMGFAADKAGTIADAGLGKLDALKAQGLSDDADEALYLFDKQKQSSLNGILNSAAERLANTQGLKASKVAREILDDVKDTLYENRGNAARGAVSAGDENVLRQEAGAGLGAAGNDVAARDAAAGIGDQGLGAEGGEGGEGGVGKVPAAVESGKVEIGDEDLKRAAAGLENLPAWNLREALRLSQDPEFMALRSSKRVGSDDRLYFDDLETLRQRVEKLSAAHGGAELPLGGSAEERGPLAKMLNGESWSMPLETPEEKRAFFEAVGEEGEGVGNRESGVGPVEEMLNGNKNESELVSGIDEARGDKNPVADNSEMGAEAGENEEALSGAESSPSPREGVPSSALSPTGEGEAARNIEPALRAIGMKQREAAETLSKMLPPGTTRETQRRMQQLVETGLQGHEPEEFKRVVSETRDKYDAMFKAEREAGLNTPELQSSPARKLLYGIHATTDEHGRPFFSELAGDTGKQAEVFKALEEKRASLGIERDGARVASRDEQLGARQKRIEASGIKFNNQPVPADLEGIGQNQWKKVSPETRAWMKANSLEGEFLKFSQEFGSTHGSMIPRLDAYRDLTAPELNDVFEQHGATGPVFQENPAAALAARTFRYHAAMRGAEMLNNLGAEFGKVGDFEEDVKWKPSSVEGIQETRVDGEKKYGIQELNDIRENADKPPIFFDDPATAKVLRDSYLGATQPERVSELLNYYDKATSLYKAWLIRAFPASHMRIAMRERIQMWMHGMPFDAPEVQNATAAMGGKEIALQTPRGALGTDQLMDLAKSKNVTKDNIWQSMKDELNGGGETPHPAGEYASRPSPGGRGESFFDKINPLNPNNAVVKGGEKLGAMMLNAPSKIAAGTAGTIKDATMWTMSERNRLALFMWELKQGKTADQAAESVAHTLYSYSKDGMSDFENNTLKRVLWFYPHIKHSIVQTADALLNNTASLSAMARLGMQPGQPEHSPEFTKPFMALPHGEDKVGNKQLLYDLGTPLEFVTKALSGDVLEELNPLIKAPLEAATGRDFFLHKDLKDADKAPHYADDLPGPLQALLGVHTTTDSKGRATERMNPWARFAIDVSPASRLSNMASRLTDPRKSVGDDLVNLLSGARTISVNEEEENNRARRRGIIDLLKEKEREGKAGEFTVFSVKDAEAKGLVKALRAPARN